MILATIQSPQTLALLRQMNEAGAARGQVLLSPRAYVHPDFPKALTSTPLMLKVTPAERDLYAEERFGPISFVIECDSADDALAVIPRLPELYDEPFADSSQMPTFLVSQLARQHVTQPFQGNPCGHGLQAAIAIISPSFSATIKKESRSRAIRR